MLSFYPGSPNDEDQAGTRGGQQHHQHLDESFQSEIVPLLNDPEDGTFDEEEAMQYQLLSNNNDETNDNSPREVVPTTTSRLRGTRRLLQLASSQVLYLYLGCAVLLLRLPFSLAIPHFVATTLHALTHGDFSMAHGEILALTLCGTVDAFLDFWCIFLFGYANLRIVKRVRLDLFRRLLRMEVAFFDAHHSGTLTSRLNSDCSAMASDLTWFFRFSIESVVRITGIAMYMLIRSPPLALCALAIVPAVAIVNKIYGDWLAQNATAVQDALASTQTVAQEALSHVRTVISLGAESQIYQTYRDRVLKHYDLNVRQTFWQGVYYMVVSTFLINTIVQAALLLYGAHLIYHNRLTADVLLAFMLYQGQLQNETMNLFQSYSSLIKSSGAGDKVFALLDRRTPPPGLGHYSHNGDEEDDDENNDENSSTTLAIRFDKVTFRYPSRPNQTVLNHMDWMVPAGRTVALVGSSGSGKSTVLALVQRLYDPSEGRILINDKDLRLMNLTQYREKIGVVTQDCVLFDGTIFDNVCFGSDESLHQDEDEQAVEARVINAIALANLADFVGTLPDGLETPIGEGGTQLSGGQKQRLAIARAIYRQPALLILDEATSSLDAASERLVQEALDQLLAQRKGMTTIIVAHRLQTVQQCDAICVLENGVIVEQGTHQQLMRLRDGLYSSMVGRAARSRKGIMDH
jgi:ATP-binding cassette subfamily B (MDR/TAP) protein 9